MGTRILIVDDDPTRQRNIEAMVLHMGYRTILADSGISALGFVKQRKDIALILLDLTMPDMDGLSILAQLRDRGGSVPVIVLVQQEDLRRALKAIKLGAMDFLTTPLAPERCQLSLSNALKLDALTKQVKRTRSLREHLALSDFITRSPEMERALVLGRRAAALDAPLLLQGEIGSGKETLARAVCSDGLRRHAPFVTVDCGNLKTKNAERWLFGALEGDCNVSSDGADSKVFGVDNGTLYFDEVGSLSQHAQMQLFTAMQSGLFEVNGVRHSFNARVIASTTKSLTELVHMGLFHPGLSQLLGSFLLPVPALRHRREDISMLVHHFTMRFASEERRGYINGIAPQTLELLKSYHWPGNVRELKNAVFRAVLLCENNELAVSDFSSSIHDLAGRSDQRAGIAQKRQSSAQEQPDLIQINSIPSAISGIDGDGEVRTLAATEEEMIRFALTHYDGQISEVARRLGIGRTTLYRKLKEYGIDVSSLSGKGMDDEIDNNLAPFQRFKIY